MITLLTSRFKYDRTDRTFNATLDSLADLDPAMFMDGFILISSTIAFNFAPIEMYPARITYNEEGEGSEVAYWIFDQKCWEQAPVSTICNMPEFSVIIWPTKFLRGWYKRTIRSL